MTGTLPLTMDDLRHLACWAEQCAARALPVFEAYVPGDPRPHEALAAARAFAGGAARSAALPRAAWGGNTAGREAGDPGAEAAARAASAAAGSAYLHPIVTPHQLNHILAPAAYAALALGTDAAEIDRAIADAPPAVRKLVAQLPPRGPSRTALGRLYHRLDTGLRR